MRDGGKAIQSPTVVPNQQANTRPSVSRMSIVVPHSASKSYHSTMLADVIVGVHLLIILFIVAGMPLVYLGAALRWPWVRSWRWRVLHLGAILFVAAESLLGITCPLTV